MHDMLVKLYDLDAFFPANTLPRDGLTIRKPIGPEMHVVTTWVRRRFGRAWASEAEMALGNRPVTCHIALAQGRLCGFACYDATARGYFGPMGVDLFRRKQGIGRSLLAATLRDMRAAGYGYAIIGGVGPAEFYRKNVGAVDIAGSTPGIWKDWLR